MHGYETRMSFRRPILAVTVALTCTACPPVVDGPAPEIVDPLLHVDTHIGTAGGGFGQPQTFVGASMPFGFVRPGPDTAGDLPREVAGFAHTSGYWYLDGFIEGFSQLHLSGTGIEDLGNVLLMPTFGMSPSKTREEGYRQRFRHANETTEAGYYAVTLDDTGVFVELTADTFAGVHRYTFPDERPSAPMVIVDVSHGLGRPGALSAYVQIESERGLVWGEMMSAGRFTGEEDAFPVFFSIEFTPPPVAVGTFDENVLSEGSTDANGPEIGAYLTFADDVDVVVAKVGISFIDVMQAHANREVLDVRTFDDVKEQTQGVWRDALSAVEVVDVGPASSDDVTAFYTALYHSLLFPTRVSEPTVDGARYIGVDRLRHDDDGSPQFTDFSMWDTYRTLHPLLTLLRPAEARAFATSILRMAAQHGSLPRWPLAVNETGVMLGTPASIILADTFLRGAQGFDVDDALAWMKDDAESTPGRTTRVTHQACVASGHCPSDVVGRSVASAIEWGAADFALANLCRATGDAACVETFAPRATLVRGHFDARVGFFRARGSDGVFPPTEDFDPSDFTDEFAEGNAWQYLYAAPYDTHGLVELLGGREAFVEKTRALFDLSMATPPRYVVDEVRAMDPYYWHGNEPDLHAAHMFTLAGSPDDTARAVRWIRETKYGPEPDDLDGNDDAGTLSAWLVLAALGLFPLPGSDVWILNAPFFDDVTIARSTFPLRITASRESADAIYVSEVRIDGRAHDRMTLRHADLAAARELAFVVVDEPAGFGEGQVLGAE